jgi:hypothetical protein
MNHAGLNVNKSAFRAMEQKGPFVIKTMFFLFAIFYPQKIITLGVIEVDV